MNKDEFVSCVTSFGIDVSSEKLDKLNLFYNLLIEWNKKINLTTIVNEKDVYLKHFYDSLTLFKEYDLNKPIKLCDVGSGAGFPGIVLKIFFPNLDITLVDSLNKRVNYLNLVIEKLGLTGIKAVHSRMEDFSRNNEEKFDLITARAVANLSLLSEISVRALKIGGSFVFMKANCDEELNSYDSCLNKLSLKIVNVNRFLLPFENSNRTLISVLKKAKTNNIYPRTIDKIRKSPL